MKGSGIGCEPEVSQRLLTGDVSRSQRRQWIQTRERCGSGSSDSATSSDEEELMSSSPELTTAAGLRGGGGHLQNFAQSDSTVAILSAHHALDGNPMLPSISNIGELRSCELEYSTEGKTRAKPHTSAGNVDWQLVCKSIIQLEELELLSKPSQRAHLLSLELEVVALSMDRLLERLHHLFARTQGVSSPARNTVNSRTYKRTLSLDQARAVDTCVRIYRRAAAAAAAAAQLCQTEGDAQKERESNRQDLRHILAAQLTSEDTNSSSVQDDSSSAQEPDTRRRLLSSSIERFLLGSGAGVNAVLLPRNVANYPSARLSMVIDLDDSISAKDTAQAVRRELERLQQNLDYLRALNNVRTLLVFATAEQHRGFFEGRTKSLPNLAPHQLWLCERRGPGAGLPPGWSPLRLSPSFLLLSLDGICTPFSAFSKGHNAKDGTLDQKRRLLRAIVAGLDAGAPQPPCIPTLSSLASMRIRQSYNVGPGELFDFVEHELDEEGALPPHLRALIRHDPFLCASCARIVVPTFSNADSPAASMLAAYEQEPKSIVRGRCELSENRFENLHSSLTLSERRVIAGYLPALPLESSSDTGINSRIFIDGVGKWLHPDVHAGVAPNSPRAYSGDIELRYCFICFAKHVNQPTISESQAAESSTCGCFVCYAASAKAKKLFLSTSSERKARILPHVSGQIWAS